MANQATVDEITALADEITTRPISDVVRSNKWGEYNFDDCTDDLEAAYAVIHPLRELPVESLLQSTAENIKNHLTALRDAINNTMAFTVKQDAPEQNRNRLAKELGNEARQVWLQTAPWTGYLFFRAGDVSEGLKKFAESHEKIDQTLIEFLTKAEDGETQINDAIAAAKEIAGKAGAGHFSEDFGKEAVEHGKTAKRWLIATVVFSVLTAIAAWAFWVGIDATSYNDASSLIQLILFKAIVLGLLFTGMIWCGRLYKTNKHQQAINKHRANALQTFQAFVEATNDPAVRDAVLMETTRSIFAITPSGYLGEPDNRSDAGSKVVEIIKAASKEATREEG